MKYLNIFIILLVSSAISFFSCNDNTGPQNSRESLDRSNSPTPPNAVTTNPKTPEPAQNAQGVWHYTCSKGCAGGSGSTGMCATCGGPLAHNAAYHSNNTPTINPPTTNPTNTNSISPVITPPKLEPAQNAVGVWHYICAKGCAGGAGKADPCATCGATLVHNTAYH